MNSHADTTEGETDKVLQSNMENFFDAIASSDSNRPLSPIHCTDRTSIVSFREPDVELEQDVESDMTSSSCNTTKATEATSSSCSRLAPNNNLSTDDQAKEATTATVTTQDKISDKGVETVIHMKPITITASNGPMLCSIEFFEGLRGAAMRRKQNVARSRDSLLAKEKLQREMIAASRRRQEELRMMKESEDTTTAEVAHVRLDKVWQRGGGGMSGVPKVQKKANTVPQSPLLGKRRNKQQSQDSDKLATIPDEDELLTDQAGFKARPAPKTNGLLGHGGQTGVPKVAKRPVTVPCSPLLGSRRKADKTEKNGDTVTREANDGMVIREANGNIDDLNERLDKENVLKSTSIPKSANFGQYGVPKVEKRPVTVPFSPLLGSRRINRNHVEPAQSEGKVTGRMSRLSASSKGSSLPNSSAGQLSSLLGLELITNLSLDSEQPIYTPKNNDNATTTPAYEPSSTARARRRAEYNAERTKREDMRRQVEHVKRRETINGFERELSKIRPQL